MTTAKYITYHDYAGFLVRGDYPIAIVPTETRHMHVAAYLTAQMESARWGTVQSYDGAGMSAGLLHNIAVQPRDLAQGSLWALLDAIRDAVALPNNLLPPFRALEEILARLDAAGLVLSEDGKLREKRAGSLATGQTIRNLLNGSVNGKTPPKGPEHENAKRWALLFSEVFSDPRTHDAQVRYAVRWLCQGRAAEELEVYRAFVHESVDSPIALNRSDLPMEVDLAMCVYHSFSANGPTPAAKILSDTLRAFPKVPETFAKRLIRKLGTSDFGRWKDDPDDKTGRYDHTRKAVEASGLWPKAMVADLMPRNL
jgi:hypothetical protein